MINIPRYCSWMSVLMTMMIFINSAASCDYPVPWIGEDLAMHITNSRIIDIDTSSNYDLLSIQVQSYLWRQINTIESDVNFKKINHILKNVDRNQHEILFLMHILYRMYGDAIIIETGYSEEYFNEWSKKYLINNQSKLALYHLIIGNKHKERYISDQEISFLDVEVVDLDILRYLAVRYENDGELDKAHEYYLLAVQSGSYSALYGLSSIEHKIDACRSRGRALMRFLSGVNDNLRKD